MGGSGWTRVSARQVVPCGLGNKPIDGLHLKAARPKLTGSSPKFGFHVLVDLDQCAFPLHGCMQPTSVR